MNINLLCIPLRSSLQKIVHISMTLMKLYEKCKAILFLDQLTYSNNQKKHKENKSDKNLTVVRVRPL